MKRSSTYADATLVAYRMHAKEAIRNWSRQSKPTRFLRRFAKNLNPGAFVLDYGCGIGTDMSWLKRQGFQIEGVDGTPDFVCETKRRNPGIRVMQSRFETVHLQPDRYDGIWANASLMHVPPSFLLGQLKKLHTALKGGGWLGVTLAWGQTKGLIERDWIPGRYIAGYFKAEATRFFRNWNTVNSQVVSRDGRSGRWIQLLARKGGRK